MVKVSSRKSVADRVGDILLHTTRLQPEQLDAAIREQAGTGKLLGDVLVGDGYVTAEELAKALSLQLHVPYLELDEPFKLSQEEVHLVPESLARKYCLIPLRKTEEPVVTLVMKDPLDLEAADTVRALTKLEVHKAVSTEARIRAAIDRFYREDAHIEQNLQDILELEPEPGERPATESPADSDQLRVQANDAPVVRFVNLLLMEAVRDRASDIHFEPAERSATVRLRIDGRLREATPPPKHLYQAIVTRIKILAAMDIAERRLPLDGRFKFRVMDRVIDVRVSSMPEVYGEKVVLRILDRAGLKLDMRDIGFDADLVERFHGILHRPHGIVLLTGPTGSGKTTTLYSALHYLRSPELNIQTVEDPVEYLIPGINQMQIRPAIGLTFADALRSILRQDPDIIMIGEIRDADTARIAMRASLTGHLVLSTLHTNDAPAAFRRLEDIGVEPYLVAATVNLVIAQRLVRVICRQCREETQVPPDIQNLAASVCPDITEWHSYRGSGCLHCRRTGYRGRTGIFEFLEVSEDMRALIQQGAGDAELRAKALSEGMELMGASGFRKVNEGETTVDEVLSVWHLARIQ